MRSYSYLMSDGGTNSGHYVELQEARLMEIIRLLLSQVVVDELWYLRTNPDVQEAVRSGQMESAREHYVISGYFENRLPRPVKVDEEWYVSEYPDVAEAIKAGTVASGRQHFERSGFLEGRLPARGWSLLADVLGAGQAAKAA